MEVTRTFTRKGEPIGKVKLTAPDGKWTLDGQELPKASVEYLVSFALQTLQDAYAGATGGDDAKKRFETKYKRLVTGTIGVRGAGIDSFTKTCRQIARKDLRAALEQDAERSYGEFTSKPTAEQNAILDGLVAANRKDIEERAKAELKRIDEAKSRVDLASLNL